MTFTNFAWHLHVRFNASMFLHAFMVEHVYIKIEGYIRKIPTFLNLVDDAQCQTSIDRIPKFVS